MATVYIITSGEYSDYHICAVTLDRDRAEKLKGLYAAIENNDYTDIEEYELDAVDKRFTESQLESGAVRYYEIHIDYNISKKSTYVDQAFEIYKLKYVGDIANEKIGRNNCSFIGGSEIWYNVNIYADPMTTKEKAKKIALDRFYKKLAEEYGL